MSKKINVFKKPFRIGRIFDIDIQIHFSWAIAFFLFTYMISTQQMPLLVPDLKSYLYWIAGGLITLAIFSSVLLHELGHSVVAIKEGIPVRNIVLFVFGGVAQIEKEPTSPLGEAKIALAGPAVSWFLGIFLIFLTGAAPFNPLFGKSLLLLAVINITIGTLNLVPAFPLDGGRILRSVIWCITKNLLRATRLAVKASQLIAFSIIAIGMFSLFQASPWGIWYVFLGLLLQQAGLSSYSQLILREALEGIKVSQFVISVHMVFSQSSLEQAAVGMSAEELKTAVVIDSCGAFQGIVRPKDFRRIPSQSWKLSRVKEIMVPKDKVIFVSPEQKAFEAIQSMSSQGAREALVVKGNRFIGVLDYSKIKKFVASRFQEIDAA